MTDFRESADDNSGVNRIGLFPDLDSPIQEGNRRAGEGTARPIEIGDGCWIGARSVILGGVRIGAGCVVAAGSVVTRDVPDNVLVAGVPACIKRQLDVGPSE